MQHLTISPSWVIWPIYGYPQLSWSKYQTLVMLPNPIVGTKGITKNQEGFSSSIIRTKTISLVRSISELWILMFEDISSSGSAGRSSPWTTSSGSTTASTGHFFTFASSFKGNYWRIIKNYQRNILELITSKAHRISDLSKEGMLSAIKDKDLRFLQVSPQHQLCWL